MKVAFVTAFYAGGMDGRLGRFLDYVHTLRDMSDPPFEFEVHAFMATDPDETLASRPPCVLGDADELWGTKRSNVEIALNARRLNRDVRASEPDVIQMIHPAPLQLGAIADAGDAALVLGPTIGGWFPVRPDEIWLSSTRDRLVEETKFRFRKLMYDRLDYDHVVSLSEYHREMLHTLGVPDDRITTLEHCVDAAFSPGPAEPDASDVPELLYVGDFSEQKGLPTVLRAVAGLDREVHVRVVGAGEIEESLRSDPRVADRITVEGFVDRSELPDYYRSADLHVVAAYDESGPTNTQIEALASGTPVVASDEPAVNEIDAPDAIEYFSPRTPEALASALEAALDDLEAMTAAARDGATSFHAQRNVTQLHSLYQSLV